MKNVVLRKEAQLLFIPHRGGAWTRHLDLSGPQASFCEMAEKGFGFLNIGKWGSQSAWKWFPYMRNHHALWPPRTFPGSHRNEKPSLAECDPGQRRVPGGPSGSQAPRPQYFQFSCESELSWNQSLLHFPAKASDLTSSSFKVSRHPNVIWRNPRLRLECPLAHPSWVSSNTPKCFLMSQKSTFPALPLGYPKVSSSPGWPFTLVSI